MHLSKRLRMIADMVTEGSHLVDVGCDHGYIPIALSAKGVVQHAIACDVRRGPLVRAQANIMRYHAEQYIEVRLSDGLSRIIPGEADSVIIAGMGGALTIRLLQEGQSVLSQTHEMILQPQSEIRKVRVWLSDHGYRIADESMVLEDGKYYQAMRAVHGSGRIYNDAELTYGPNLLNDKNEVLREYLSTQKKKYVKILDRLSDTGAGSHIQRREEILNELAVINRAEAYYDM